MSAAAANIAVVRRRMRDWLDGLQWPAEPAEDIVLAVSEAVTNAVEHAYPSAGQEVGQVEIYAAVSQDTPATGGRRRVQVRVRDHGRWRSRPDEPGERRVRFGGHGLVVMQALTAQMAVHTSAEGTEIELISQPVLTSDRADDGNASGP